MDGSAGTPSKYRDELEQRVRESEERYARAKQRFDTWAENHSDSREENRYQQQLDDSAEARKAARKRLAAYRALPHAELEAELATLHAEVQPEEIQDALDEVRPRLVEAALSMLAAFAEICRAREVFDSKVRRITEVERQLLSDDGIYRNPRAQPGFGLLHGPVRANAGAVMAELERIAGTKHPLAKAIGRDARGRLTIAHFPANEALSWIGID